MPVAVFWRESCDTTDQMLNFVTVGTMVSSMNATCERFHLLPIVEHVHNLIYISSVQCVDSSESFFSREVDQIVFLLTFVGDACCTE